MKVSWTYPPARATRPAPEAVQWLLRLEASPADGTLRQEFEAWVRQDEAHRAAYRSAQHTWVRLGKLPPELIPEARRLRDGRVEHRDAAEAGQAGTYLWAGAGAMLAAACLLLVAAPVIQRHLEADHLTSVAEQRDVVLPDGSLAHLDADSAIAVDYAGGERRVALVAGQAFFQVAADPDASFHRHGRRRVGAGDGHGVQCRQALRAPSRSPSSPDRWKSRRRRAPKPAVSAGETASSSIGRRGP